MVVNGRLRNLQASYVPGIGWGVREKRRWQRGWGRRPKTDGLWVNTSNNGWTTSLSWNGRVFESQHAAQAYVAGYDAARQGVAEGLGWETQ